jgi:hypothetical protein
VRYYSKLAKPLNDLSLGISINKSTKSTPKQLSNKWFYVDLQQKAFETLKEYLSSPPILAYAD